MKNTLLLVEIFILLAAYIQPNGGSKYAPYFLFLEMPCPQSESLERGLNFYKPRLGLESKPLRILFLVSPKQMWKISTFQWEDVKVDFDALIFFHGKEIFVEI